MHRSLACTSRVVNFEWGNFVLFTNGKKFLVKPKTEMKRNEKKGKKKKKGIHTANNEINCSVYCERKRKCKKIDERKKKVWKLYWFVLYGKRRRTYCIFITHLIKQSKHQTKTHTHRINLMRGIRTQSNQLKYATRCTRRQSENVSSFIGILRRMLVLVLLLWLHFIIIIIYKQWRKWKKKVETTTNGAFVRRWSCWKRFCRPATLPRCEPHSIASRYSSTVDTQPL